MNSFVLFNNKGGVGKTTLTFNLAHMMAKLGKRVLAIDCDPQCYLTSIFLDDDELVELWNDEMGQVGSTVASCVERVRRGKGDVLLPDLREVSTNLWFLPGHLSLSRFEQPLAEEWPKALSQDNERALDVTTALLKLTRLAARKVSAQIVMLDVGPSLGALNRAALLACDAVILPVAPDLFSLQGLRNVGPTLVDWRKSWNRIAEVNASQLEANPSGRFHPIGYLVQQHLARADRPVRSYAAWANLIPSDFHRYVLEDSSEVTATIANDSYCLGTIKHYSSLAPMAHTARKPMFDLRQADGVGGGQIQAVAKCREDFKVIASRILAALNCEP